MGIGGVHFYSNCEIMCRFDACGCRFSVDELYLQAVLHAWQTDRELFEEGWSKELEFARFRVSNALLTVGFMKALDIKEMRTIKIDMADGILLERRFWGDAVAAGVTAPGSQTVECE